MNNSTKSSILAYFQPSSTQKNREVENEVAYKERKGVGRKSVSSKRPSLKPLQDKTNAGDLGRSSQGGKKKRKRQDEEACEKKQSCKPQRIIPSGKIVVYEDTENGKENEGIQEKPIKDTTPSPDTEVKTTNQQPSACQCGCHCSQRTTTGSQTDTERPAKKVKLDSVSIQTEATVTDEKSTTTTQTPEEEALELMGSGEVTEKYWEQLAEERREALAEALDENKQLHEELKELKEEKTKLEELAGQAEYFAAMLKVVTADETETDTTENEDSSVESDSTQNQDSAYAEDKTETENSGETESSDTLCSEDNTDSEKSEEESS